MPYRIDLRPPAGDSAARLADRLIELGSLDIELDGDSLAALLPDDVPVGRVAAAIGAAALAVSAARGRDDGSVWVLAPRPVRAGRWHLLPVAPAGTGVGPLGRGRPTGEAGHDQQAGDPLIVRLLDSDAFGTGLHPTTALCLEILDEVIDPTPPATALDVGTGSGVLALALAAAGVREVVGLEIDEAALRAAAANAARNDRGGRLRLVPGGPDAVDGRWPLVVANILAAPLIEMAPLLVRRLAGGGRLLLSGIPDSLASDVERTYRRFGLHPLTRRSRAGWSALLLAASW